ncbi:MAG TPA: IS200/IS605 family transposase [Candidatus Acidoferrales bacterium]|nr:IS200/IS605 family transposase [Candidatus Acidoferrales bacterium]
MSHSYAQNVIHVVFSTKDRCKVIGRALQPRIWAYAAGICKKHGIFVHGVGGMEDHIHLLIQVPPVLALAKAVLAIKSNSSRWANEQGHKLAWQRGYAAFSVSASIVPTVVRYIQNQEAHHRKMSFDEEFLALLKKHGLQFDPKFVFG